MKWVHMKVDNQDKGKSQLGLGLIWMLLVLGMVSLVVLNLELETMSDLQHQSIYLMKIKQYV